MRTDSRIWIAGHNGMVGSALARRLHWDNDLDFSPHRLFDLRVTSDALRYCDGVRPKYVYLAAAQVGGIGANSSEPARFIFDNLMIAANVIDVCQRYDVKRLCYLGSSCIYPRDCPQPMKEEYLLTGPLEPTNQWYAIAKIAGLKLCEAYRQQYGFSSVCLMPTNLYGPGDRFDQQRGHVIGSLIDRFHKAKCANLSAVNVWGSGRALREFLFVDDLAEAAVMLMEMDDPPFMVNIGSGEEVPIGLLALRIKNVVGYRGKIVFDETRPEGPPRKFLDSSKIRALGWKPKVGLTEGLERTYEWYLQNVAEKVAA